MRLAAALFTAVCGAMFAFGLQWDPRETRALRADWGIVAVTPGMRPLVLGNTWQKLLLPALPSLQTVIGGTLLRPPTSPAGSLIVWQKLGGGYQAYSPTLAPVLIGDRGESLRVLTRSHYWPQAGSNLLAVYEIATYPRRCRQVRLHFNLSSFGNGKGQTELWVPNPAPGSYPEWAPGALRRVTGPLEVTLERFRTRVTDSEVSLVPMLGGETQLELRVREGGKAVPDG